MKRGLTWVVASALVACASPKPPVTPTRAPVQGTRICWREENLGTERKLMHLIADELTASGYSLVDTKCDLLLGFTTLAMSQVGYSDFRDVTMYVRKPDGALVDKIDLPFDADAMPRDDAPRLARLVVNALNGNQKTYTFLDPAAATASTPADSASIANTRFKFCDVATFVDFYANQTALISGNIKCASHWTQSGDHVEFDCNGITLYDTRVRSPYLFGTWRRARADADPNRAQRGQTCLQQLGPAVAAVESPKSDGFDRGATAEALGNAASKLDECGAVGAERGPGHVKVTFGVDGHVTVAKVDVPPFAGTKVGECVEEAFKKVTIPPFSGGDVTVGKSFVVR